MARHIQNFFESLSSLTYHRLNKVIWSVIPFLLFLFVCPANVLYAIAARSWGGAGRHLFAAKLVFLQLIARYIENVFENLSSLTYDR